MLPPIRNASPPNMRCSVRSGSDAISSRMRFARSSSYAIATTPSGLRRRSFLHPLAQSAGQLRRLDRRAEQLRLAEDRARGQGARDAVRRAAHDLDPVAGPDVALLDHAQVGAWPTARGEELREARVAHPEAELEARQARLRDLEQGAAHGPALADHGPRDGQAAHGEVLAERARSERAAQLPPTTRCPRSRTRTRPCRGR